MEKYIKKELLRWYSTNQRKLPWRSKNKNRLPDAYFVLVSEYMLQQTTVNTVKNRFLEFVNKWPNIECLSKIRNSTILNFWSGLGYYSRAKNLLQSAKIIHSKYNNKIPNKYEDLIKLPGIGHYTAKAILGIAFNKPVIPIDANIERILARLYGFKSPLNKIKKKIEIKSN